MIALDNACCLGVVNRREKEMSSAAVRVVARIRPDSRGGEGGPCVQRSGDSTVAFKSGETYSFSSVLGPESTQDETYRVVCGGGKTMPSFVQEALSGFNTTVMAYGQTGSGKTHTMMGENEDGIIPRLARELFGALDKLIRERRSGEEGGMLNVTVRVSFVEIYRERLRDLLDIMGTKTIRIREGDQKVVVENLTEEFVTSTSELLEVMRRGNSARSVASTRMNEESSRSHSVFTLKIEQVDSEQGTTLEGKIQLVDLAGSEQIKRTGAQGDRLEEAKSINLSLSCLGNVVSALVEKRPFIPYRESKLTRMLQDSLGGSAKTCLVVALSPSPLDENETLSTIRFGQRAQKVQNLIVKNVRRTVDELERLLAKAEEELRLIRLNGPTISPMSDSGGSTANNHQEEIQQRLEDLEIVVERLQRENEQIAQEKSKVEKEKMSLEMELDDALLREKRLEADLSLSRKETEEAKRSRKEIALKGREFSAALESSFQNDLTQLTDKCVRYQIALAEKEEEISFLKHGKIDEVWITLRDAQARLKDVELGKEQVQSELAIAHMQLKNRQEHVEALQYSHARVQKNLLKEIESLESKLSVSKEEIRKYKLVMDGQSRKARAVVSRPIRVATARASSPSAINKTPQSMSSLSPSSPAKKSQVSPIRTIKHDSSIMSNSFESFVEQQVPGELSSFASLGDQPSVASTVATVDLLAPFEDQPKTPFVKTSDLLTSSIKRKSAEQVPLTKDTPNSKDEKNTSHASSVMLQIVPFSLSPSKTDLAQLKRMPVREFFFEKEHSIQVEQRWVLDGKGGTELGFGSAVYPAAVALAFTLALNKHVDLRGKRVIELGCGTGLVALAASLWAKAHYVLATDGDEMTVKLCDGNIKRNKIEETRCRATKLLWGDTIDWEKLDEGKPFDIVVASDVVALPYRTALVALVATLVSLRQRFKEINGQDASVEILLGYSPRNVSEEDFFAKMREQGFDVRRLGKELVYPDFAGEQEDCQLFSII